MKVLVVGGGIAGLTLAYWLHECGIDATVVERAGQFRPIGSMTTMYGEGQQVAEGMGILDGLRERAFRQERQTLRDERGRLIRSYGLNRAHALQGGVLTLRRSDWHAAIYEAARGRVPIRFGVSVSSLNQEADGVSVGLSDGTREAYDLVIGADGVHSAVRGLVFGEGYERPIGYGLMTFILDSADVTLRAAGLAPFSVHEWFVPEGYIEITTLAEGTVAGIFVYPSLPGRRVPPAEERHALLQERYGAVPGGVGAVLEAVHDPSLIYCDDLAQVLLPAWSRGRIALVGDAAHALTPFLGAGGGKAMRGAYTLARELAATGGDHGAAFARYEAAMRPAVERVQRQTLGMGKFVLNGRPLPMLLKRSVFRFLPEAMVIRMRSATPQGTAWQAGVEEANVRGIEG